VLALQFLLGALGSVPRALLLRDLRYVTLSRIDLVVTIVSGFLGVTAALLGLGVWAIVIRIMSEQFLLTTFPMFFAPWRPRHFIDRSAAKDLFKFTFPLFGIRLFQFASRNVDKALIGRLLGATDLGLYSRAYALIASPLGAVTAPMMRILFAAFSTVQDDHERIRRTYLRFTGALAVVTVPGAVGMIVVARPMVHALFGEQWLGMVTFIQILAIATLVGSPTRIHEALYMATGRTDLQLRYNIATRIVLTVCIVAGLPWGAVGMAVGMTVGSCFDSGYNLHQSMRLVSLRWSDLFLHLRGPLAGSAIMALAVAALEQVPQLRALNVWLQLGALILLGVGVYGVFLHLARPIAYEDVIGVVREQLRKRRG
jgi:PST family polysaccharide transporter